MLDLRGGGGGGGERERESSSTCCNWGNTAGCAMLSGSPKSNDTALAVIPSFGHVRIPHALLGMGSTALVTAVALPR